MSGTERVETAMRRALELARNGPATGVNPRVGCVILSPAGDVVAEGWHRGVGTAHAEVDALAKLPPEGARGATAVVTLEPCNHQGHTGPCAQALIDAGVARVVYAVADPGPRARGGAERLRAAGVEVVAGVLRDEVHDFLADWLFVAEHGRPEVRLKWAMSLDGRVAAADGSSRWISSPEARETVHDLRARADAVLVGTGTVLADDPALTARRPDGALHERQPVPVVVGERGIPGTAAVFRHPRQPILLRTRELRGALGELAAQGIRTVLAEPGPELASALVREGLVDWLEVYLAPILLGGPRTALGDLGVARLAERLEFEIAGHAVVGGTMWLRARRRG